MTTAQPGILQAVAPAARYLFFTLASPLQARAALARLQAQADGRACVVAIGSSLAAALGADVPGLRDFPVLPVTDGALASTAVDGVVFIAAAGRTRR